MALPIIEGSQVNTPSSGIQLNGESFRQAALAPGKLGAAIGQDVGGFFDEVSQKSQANRNFNTVASADLQMRKAHDDFTASLVTRPDQRTWLPAWQDQVQQTKDNILNGPDVGPDVKRQLTAQVNNWDVATSSALRMKALDKGVQESYETMVQASNMAYMSGSPTAIQDGDNIIKAGVSNYATSPVKGQLLMAQGKQTAFKAQADSAIDNDPINAPDILEDTLKDKMSPIAYRPLYREALRRQSSQQSLNSQSIYQQIAATGSIDPKILSDQVDAKAITQTQANQLTGYMKKLGAQQTREDMKAERDQYNISMKEADDHDWVNDKDAQITAAKINNEGLGWTQPALQRGLDEHIQSKMKAAASGQSGLSPVQKQIFQQMQEDRTSNGLTVPLSTETVVTNSHTFSPDETEVQHNFVSGGLEALRKMDPTAIQDKFGKGVTREQVLQAEQSHAAGIQTKMRDWFQQNPQATYDEANDYRISLEKPYVMGAVSTSLKPKQNLNITTREEFEALPSGAPFVYNGRAGTKK